MSTLWTPGGEHPVEREASTAPSAAAGAPPAGLDKPGDGGPGGLDPEGLAPEERAELEAQMTAMQEELASAPASVVIANHAVGLFQLAAIHLNQRPPNLPEGQLAIDAMGALVEGLAGRLGVEEEGLRGGLAQLRMAYVQLKSTVDDD